MSIASWRAKRGSVWQAEQSALWYNTDKQKKQESFN